MAFFTIIIIRKIRITEENNMSDIQESKKFSLYKPRLASNSDSSCLCLLSAKITGVCQHTSLPNISAELPVYRRNAPVTQALKDFNKSLFCWDLNRYTIFHYKSLFGISNIPFEAPLDVMINNNQEHTNVIKESVSQIKM